MRTFLALALAIAATGCGQTGSLYLPDDTVETPVEIRGPGEAAAPAEPGRRREGSRKSHPAAGSLTAMAGTGKLWLVDGSSYLYRAFFALPPLTTSQGVPTGAVLGVLNMLNKLLKEENPELVAVVLDAPGRTFRDELFEEYKAHRPPMPDDLRAQIAPLIEAIPALGLPLLRIEGVEADDVIGTLAERAERAGLEVVISTGDKDMAQLVNDRITLVNTMFETKLDRAGVKAKFDVLPEQIVDYLALVGDSSDNIPGVPKVGPKTAAKWLGEYGSAEAIVANAAAIAGKVGESLRDNLATLELSRKLATIRRDLELPQPPTALTRKPPDVEALTALYKRLELNSLLRQLTASSGAPDSGGRDPASARLSSGGASEPESRPPAPARQYETITTAEQLDAWIAALAKAPLFAFDTETTSLDYMQAEIVGVSFCIEPGKAAYLPLAHDYAGAPDQLDRTKTLARLKPLLEDPKRPKVGHHLKYDAHVLLCAGIALAGMRYDSMLESYVLNSTATRHDMDSCARHYLGIETIKYEDVAGKGAKQIPFNQVPVEHGIRIRGGGCGRDAAAAPRAARRTRFGAGAARGVRGDRAAARAGAAADGAPRRARGPRPPEEAGCGDREAPRGARGRGAQVGRAAVQPGLAEAAPGNTVHQAGPAGSAEDRHGPALDGRERTGGTG